MSFVPHRPAIAAVLAAAFLWALGAALALPGPLTAQEAERGADTLPSPEPAADTLARPLELRDLVVTAHGTPVPRDQLTSSVEIFTREELEARSENDVGDLLRGVTGAHVVRSGSFGAVTSLFLRGGESDFVQVLVDGVEVNRPGGSFDFSNLTTDNLERIEIVRGPSSVLYGSDAATGVVQIFTRRGEGAPRWSGSARAGTFGSLEWENAVAGGSETLSYSASVSRFVTDGTREFNNDFRNLVASGRIGVRPGPDTDASLVLRFTDSEFHFPTNSAGETVDRNAFRSEEVLTARLEAGHFFTERLEGRVALSTNEIDAGTDDAMDSPGDTLGFFAFESREDVDRRVAESHLSYHLSPRTTFTAGVELESESEVSRSESRSAFGTSLGETDVDRDNLGYFAEAVTRLGGLSLSAGARIDDNEEFGTFETFRAGAAYRFATGTRLRASYGNAFKEPTFIENFGSPPFRGNPDLEPEETESWEVGVTQSFLGERLSLEATFFDQDFEDLIQFTFEPPEPGGPNFFNVAASEARGLELGAEADLRPGLRIDLGYTYLDTEVTDAGFDVGEDATFVEGDRLLRRPEHTFHAGLGYRNEGLGTLRVDLVHVGDRIDRDFGRFPSPRIELSGYTRVDLALRPRLPGIPGSPEVRPILRIENLLDDDHEEVANFRAPGRTILAGLETGLGF